MVRRMKIKLHNVGKRFNREWIFRKFSFEFMPGGRYAITGPNGSGKSTLLNVVSGGTLHNEGTISFRNGEQVIEEPYKHLAIAAPYLELIEEMTAKELIHFHQTFKHLSVPYTVILETCGIATAAEKQIRYFSSGMKQRLKLGLAFFSEVNVLLLDEPTTNLDRDGIEVYRKLMEEQTNGKTIIISSNDEKEYEMCSEVLAITDYK